MHVYICGISTQTELNFISAQSDLSFGHSVAHLMYMYENIGIYMQMT